MESGIHRDTCVSDCIKQLHFLFILESYLGIIPYNLFAPLQGFRCLCCSFNRFSSTSHLQTPTPHPSTCCDVPHRTAPRRTMKHCAALPCAVLWCGLLHCAVRCRAMPYHTVLCSLSPQSPPSTAASIDATALLSGAVAGSWFMTCSDRDGTCYTELYRRSAGLLAIVHPLSYLNHRRNDWIDLSFFLHAPRWIVKT